jgi:hypothetical protein
LFVCDEKVLTNRAGYGQPVLAVGDGTIVHAVNDEHDQDARASAAQCAQCASARPADRNLAL